MHLIGLCKLHIKMNALYKYYYNYIICILLNLTKLSKSKTKQVSDRSNNFDHMCIKFSLATDDSCIITTLQHHGVSK